MTSSRNNLHQVSLLVRRLNTRKKLKVLIREAKSAKSTSAWGKDILTLKYWYPRVPLIIMSWCKHYSSSPLISTLLYVFFTSFYHNTQVIFIFPLQCALIFGRYKIVVNTIHSYSIIMSFMSCPVPESLLLDNPGITFPLQAHLSYIPLYKIS
jgi:hypothetical protein